MSSKPQVTITLGRAGRVVKRAGAGSEVAHSDYGQSLGSKRSIRERLGNNSDDYCSQSQSKRPRSDHYKWSSTKNDRRIGQNDLRFKLMHKNLPRQTNIDSDVHDVDLREKISQTVQMPLRFDACQHEVESKTSVFLRQILPTRSVDDMLHGNFLRKSYSSWPLKGFRHRSPGRLLGAYGGVFPPRNYCNDLRQVPTIRSVDPPNTVPLMVKGVIDTPRPATFASKEHPKPAMPLPLPNGVLKIPYMAEEPTSVSNLLHSLGLGKYAILFQAEVDMAALKQMGDNDLKELGIPMGPRKKILAVSLRSRQRHT
uniref:SEC23-interacting protein n=1 Tax=Anthurium amnicola TaxID=1678845 RepID=A0A1D1YST4_9ARAE